MRHITIDDLEEKYNNNILIISFENYQNKRYPVKPVYQANLVLVADVGISINDKPCYEIIKDRYYGVISRTYCTLETEADLKKLVEWFTDLDLTIQ